MEQYFKQMLKMKDIDVCFYDVDKDHDSTRQWEWNLDKVEQLQELHSILQYADIVVTQSLHSQKSIAFMYAMKEKYKIPVFAEFDDDPYSLFGSHPYYKDIGAGTLVELWADEQIKKSDGIIVSTPYLKKLFSKYNQNISIVPNCIDFDIWDNLKPAKNHKDKIYIGWIGGGNHFDDLELIEEPIKYILNKYSHVRFVIAIGHEVPKFLRHKHTVQYDLRNWKNIYEYPQFTKSLGFDIGLAPLRDRAFNRCKSNLKWLEYSALQIPTIASPVEPYLGTNAYMVSNTKEWINNMELLINNKELRLNKGKEAYSILKDKFDVKKISEDYKNILVNEIMKVKEVTA